MQLDATKGNAGAEFGFVFRASSSRLTTLALVLAAFVLPLIPLVTTVEASSRDVLPLSTLLLPKHLTVLCPLRTSDETLSCSIKLKLKHRGLSAFVCRRLKALTLLVTKRTNAFLIPFGFGFCFCFSDVDSPHFHGVLLSLQASLALLLLLLLPAPLSSSFFFSFLLFSSLFFLFFFFFSFQFIERLMTNVI